MKAGEKALLKIKLGRVRCEIPLSAVRTFTPPRRLRGSNPHNEGRYDGRLQAHEIQPHFMVANLPQLETVERLIRAGATWDRWSTIWCRSAEVP